MTRGDGRNGLTAMVFAAALIGAGAELGHAQALSSGESARLLARVEAIDGKCRFLAPADHDALKTLAARAEVAAAGEGGPEEANEAVATGRSEGSSGACNEESARLVRSAFASAESAASGNVRRSQAAVPAPGQRPPQASRRYGAWQPGLPLAGPEVSALDRYAIRLEAYYLDLRCRHLTRPDAVRFWRSILEDQRAAARQSGADAVAGVQPRARLVASRGWCGWNTARRVMDGYRGVVGSRQ
jgi:hypothetical protein